ncbi:hypothetical protein NHI66_000536 [Clostridium botulinum]|nr:hypothetical protein [Clostridium sporogenes]EJP6471289.1 hypothetical protein [Clostridium botulinum]
MDNHFKSFNGVKNPIEAKNSVYLKLRISSIIKDNTKISKVDLFSVC